jgi:hypothetical protein
MKVLPLLLVLMSCGSLPGARSYLAEMTREDRSFFEPQHDFPVVVGDSGSWGYSEEVRRLRTPASAQELEEYDLEQSLNWELAELESKLSPEEVALYGKYSHHFATTSERIYFLKIPYQERYSYLEARGIIPSPLTSWFTDPVTRPLDLGMSKNEVLSLLGRPQRVDIAGSASAENERWLYAQQGSPQYVYFEAGKVGGWE